RDRVRFGFASPEPRDSPSEDDRSLAVESIGKRARIGRRQREESRRANGGIGHRAHELREIDRATLREIDNTQDRALLDRTRTLEMIEQCGSGIGDRFSYIVDRITVAVRDVTQELQ